MRGAIDAAGGRGSGRRLVLAREACAASRAPAGPGGPPGPSGRQFSPGWGLGDTGASRPPRRPPRGGGPAAP